jgi:DNA-binding transcriptional LysR family regulator
LRGLNLDQLRALLEVVEQGSFSAAARRLNLTQPAVSLQIRELERRFGVRLIERLGKQAHATLPGRELVDATRRIFRECDDADAAMRRFREGWVGRVHVGTTLTAMIYRLPPILRTVRLDNPGIDLVVTNTPTKYTIENIIRNRIDLGLVNLPIENKQVKVTPLCSEAMVAIFAAGTRGVPDEITPDYVAQQNLLVEQATSAAYPAGSRMVIRSCVSAAHADAARNRRGLEERGRIQPRHGHRAGGLGRYPQVRFPGAAASAGAFADPGSDRASQQAE